ncbi:MAG: phage regulatory CII family protein [Marinomonas sp.]|uniref:phage regulatory CII family protein n=1 Tax=Marinomonas sp. TaxID=1904862 RepID=UPI003C73AD5C
MALEIKIDHFTQAIHDLVHKSELGTTRIAEVLGMSKQVLINKVNPYNVYNKLTVHELHAIQMLTGDDSVLRIMQADLVRSTMAYAPPSILEAMINQGKECGDVFAVVQKALADNRLTERERADVLKEIREAISSLEITEQAVIAHGNVACGE